MERGTNGTVVPDRRMVHVKCDWLGLIYLSRLEGINLGLNPTSLVEKRLGVS